MSLAKQATCKACMTCQSSSLNHPMHGMVTCAPLASNMPSHHHPFVAGMVAAPSAMVTFFLSVGVTPDDMSVRIAEYMPPVGKAGKILPHTRKSCGSSAVPV